MSQERTYTIIQRDRYGEAVNTITGLDELAANTLAAVLRTGDAYQGDRPWTCDIKRELTRQEAVEQLATRWLGCDEHLWLGSPVELAAALDLLATGLNSLGDQPIRHVWLQVSLQVTTESRDDEAERRATVDLLAQAFGGVADDRHGFYGTRPKAEHVKVYTAVRRPPVDEPVVEAIASPVAPVDVEASPDVFALVEVVPEPTAPAEHRPDSFWKGDEPGSCGASCACGTTYDGFDSLDEASELIDKHVAAENAGSDEPQPVAPERVDEILGKLNELTKDPDANGREPDWWDWIQDAVPEFDAEATAASSDTGTLHLTDGTVLRWSTETSWTRAAVA